MKEKTKEVSGAFSTSLFMKGMTMERSNSSAWSVARASHDQETWRDDQRIHEGNNHWSATNVTGASGENSWRESHSREAIQLHKVWQEIFRIKRLEVPLEDPCRRETIQVHNLWQELFHIVWLKIAPPIIHQRIQKGKRQTPLCTKCSPGSVNVNIILGAVQKWCHLPRGRGVSQKLMW